MTTRISEESYGFKPRRFAILPRVLVIHRNNIVPSDICEGDFIDTWLDAPAPDTFDVILDLPFDITVTQIALSNGNGYGIQLGYGASGAGVSYMLPTALPAGTVYNTGPSSTSTTDADGITGPGMVGALVLGTSTIMLTDGQSRAYLVNQAVPAHGYLQWNTENQLDAGDISFFIHYTYNCADAP